MKVLLDTNIVIHRENDRVSNYSVGHLYRWLDQLHYEKYIHPSTISEIEKYNNPARGQALAVKLESYQVLQTNKSSDEAFIKQTGYEVKTENDIVDNNILYELYLGSVDCLITEDKALLRKAENVGIRNRVFSIDEFIDWATKINPQLVEYDALSVYKDYFGKINCEDPFFDSFRAHYDNFNNWFAHKTNEEAYICKSQNRILGFLYLKTEDESENYHDITPAFKPRRRLKVGTFKTESTGFRLGERFIKIIFDNAIERELDEIYVTLFRDSDELNALADLLFEWGFVYYGKKASKYGEEDVLVKRLDRYHPDKSVKENYPIVKPSNRYIMAIEPRYHTSLFPDSALLREKTIRADEFQPHMYALEKVYVSWAYKLNAKPGDIVLIYRNGETPGRKAYESVLTTICVVDEIIDNFENKEAFLASCQNRSVFTNNELEYFWNHSGDRLKVIRLIYLKSLNRRPTLGFLWDSKIVEQNSGPRGLHYISEEQFAIILKKSETVI